MQTKGFLEFIKNSTYLFGCEVNSNRALPLKWDGLIPSYRRVMYAGLNFSKMTKTATIVGDVIGKYHPHGLDSVNGVINNITRLGLFTGRGQFGFKTINGADIDAAQTRYTECMLSQKWRNIIEPMIKYVPFIEGEIEGNVEPRYLPTPIPLSFMFPRIGLGCGCNCRIPALDTQSLIDAMIKDDPSLLKAPYGMRINYERSELDQLWNYGVGAIQYEYDVNSENINGTELIVISAKSAEVFKPDLSVFDKYINSGKMYMIDLTDDQRVAVGIGKNAYVDWSNFTECLELAKQVAVNRKTYRLTVADTDGKSYAIPLKIWLRECYNNYVELVKRMQADKLARAEVNRKVFEYLPIVGKLITQDPNITDDDILKKVEGLTIDVLRIILSKSISMLRKSDTSKELKKYDDEIAYWNSFSPKNYTDAIMKDLVK